MFSLRSTFLVSVALMLPCLAAPAAAEEIGRLFFTPQQRQDLDRRRTTNRAEEETPQIKEGPLTLEGHVQRSSGKTTTWINGVPQYDSHSSRDPARITVAPNVGEPGVSLKVGQIYERTSGEVRDDLQGGEITVGKHTSIYERTSGQVRDMPQGGAIPGGKPASNIAPETRRGAAANAPAPAR